MKEATHILDQPLPLNQDFKQLKNKGVEYIQEFVGAEWTNYNPSDPGITILEQVCFALTELGYCHDFPMEDILTNAEGAIDYEDQFYPPEQLLTTSPVTITDYRKLIIDAIDSVANVFIEPIHSAISMISRAYRVHLYLDPAFTEQPGMKVQGALASAEAQILNQVFYLLNRNRNWGELFLVPQIFRTQEVKISGVIEIDKATQAPQILRDVQEDFEHFIFPAATQVGYDFMKDEGADDQEIFQGPLLRNGWISDEALKEKRNVITLEELGDLLSKIKGINYIKKLVFSDRPNDKTMTSNLNQLMVISLEESIRSKNLIIQCNGNNVYTGLDENSTIEFAPRTSKIHDTGSAVKIKPDLPTGSYREIDTYYSIQNTFPEAFGVGESGVDSNATEYQIAQSKQLKGFLTLFDQPLANQFSQLSNVGKLFSFKNATSSAPVDRERFYAKQSKLDDGPLAFPAPFESFSPTYFCQSLYDIPHIRPLLKGTQMFDFSTSPVENDVLNEDSWKKFKKDPYNSYIWGLMNILSDSHTDIQRRNNILDHLLARHGQSPSLIDAIIDPKIYTGDTEKGQVIFKSLLLQNLGVLSYNRTKSFDYLGADPISDQMETLPQEGDTESKSHTVDFILDMDEINEQEKIGQNEFSNYSALELKLKLLFGLQHLYDQYIYECSELFDSVEPPLLDVMRHKSQVATWLINQRKGQINIETNLLLKCLTYKIAYRKAGDRTVCHEVSEKANYHQALGIEQLFREDLQQPGVELSEDTTIEVTGEPFSVIGTDESGWPEDDWLPIPETKDEIAIQATSGSEALIDLNHELFSHAALFLFPDFIPEIANPGFRSRLHLFLQSDLPTHVSSHVLFLGVEQMEALIPLFCNWRNDLRQLDGSSADQKVQENKLEESTLALIQELIKIYEQGDG
ncbi:MAG: hypothetical protein AAF391_01325 [Bacteroidota bacterium]